MNSNSQKSIEKTAKELIIETLKQENRLRLYITIAFVIIYLIFISSVIGIWVFNLFRPVSGRTDLVKDMILTISGLISAPLGLIIGYYFGTDKNKQK